MASRSFSWLRDRDLNGGGDEVEEQQTTQLLEEVKPTEKCRRYSVSKQELGLDSPSPPQRPQSNLRTRMHLFLTCLLTLALVWSLVRNGQLWSLDPANDKPLGLNCGSTAKEALAKGCKFELINTAWIPGPCFDKEANDEYRVWLKSPERAAGSFPYFKQQRNESSRFRDEDEYMMWEDISWTTNEEHRAHCAWMLPKLSKRAYLYGKRRIPMEHTLHCAKESLKLVTKTTRGSAPDDRHMIDVHNSVSFGNC